MTETTRPHDHDHVVPIACGAQFRSAVEGLARSHTAPAREVRQANALFWAAAEGTAAVGRARAANQGSMMRPARG
jgi:hypothetical protein